MTRGGPPACGLDEGLIKHYLKSHIKSNKHWFFFMAVKLGLSYYGKE